jgi:hypothetical protein
MTNPFSDWTPQMVNEFNARNQRVVGNHLFYDDMNITAGGLHEHVPDSDDVLTEAELHDAIIAYAKHKGWICFYSPMCYRTRRCIGEQDFTILADHGRTFLIEVKTAKGKLTSEQLGLALWAEKLGHKIHLVRSVAEFLEVVK